LYVLIEKNPSNINSISVIEEFIQAGNQLKKQQIEVLTQNNFELLAQEYKNDPITVKLVLIVNNLQYLV
tara:strand:+ start:390 stop:596 length:207 start_codon:yes stop_codon:yes gene_type:complete